MFTNYMWLFVDLLVSLCGYNTISVDGEMFSNWRNTNQSQVKQFQDFILRANKYPTLSIFDGKGSQTAVKKVILVEVN